MLKFLLFLIFFFYCKNESFFKIKGGVDYMYYFIDIGLGSPGQVQSAILDTGSDTLSVPCTLCKKGDCGRHEHPHFNSKVSETFNVDKSCYFPVMFSKMKVCQFVKSYAEGSSLLGINVRDRVELGDVPNGSSRNLKGSFGCTIKETGLFKSQFADGILGMDDQSELIDSLERSQ